MRPRGVIPAIHAYEPVDLLLAGRIGLQDLDPPLRDLYNLGFIDGRASLSEALEAAESAADRYYRLAFDSAATRVHVPSMSFADLCRIRGEFDRADMVDARLVQRLALAAPPT